MSFEKEDNRDRQADWRSRQEKKGLVQVRVWVPKGREADLKKYALCLRDDNGFTASTGKQKYQAKKLAKELEVGLPPDQILNDKYRLDVWMTAIQCLEGIIELPKQPHGRQASKAQIEKAEEFAAQLGVEPPRHFYEGHLSLGGWITRARSLGAGP